jgi:hypothetical protein
VAKSFTDEDDALLEELGVEVETKRQGSRTAREERIIAGFEEIQRFVAEHGRTPLHGEDRGIFERLYAVRLDRLRELEEARSLLAPLDHQGLLNAEAWQGAPIPDDIADEELLAQLGIEDEAAAGITALRHVRTAAEKREAEEVASREKCEDFARFKPLFERLQKDLDSGVRETRPFASDATIQQGSWFILGGQKAYVAERGELFKNPQGRPDARLRVIFDNGTQSNMLMRSLERGLQKDEAGRRITDPVAGPLFSGETGQDDQATGTIYVLRSKSDHPMVAAHRDLVHKIGVTTMSVEQRIARARFDATFLMADVEVVATYELFNINQTKLENLIHRVFDPARLNIEIQDRFGNPVVPREWFLAPLFAVDEAVSRIKDGTITSYIYDPAIARLRKR